MKILFAFISIITILTHAASAQTVWKSSQGTVTFNKPGFADWKLAANQDRISDSVWITRASSQSLFNIRKESEYGSDSPLGTMWAFGKTDSFATLKYKTFVDLSGGSPQSLIGQNLVLRLVAENIFLDVTFLTYGSGGGGATFSYIRAARILGITEETSSLPAFFELKQNYPNPFNPSTVISYQIPTNGKVSLKIFDAIGREVATLVNDVKEAGTYSVTFSASERDGSKIASGIYLARLQCGNFYKTMKMTMTK